MYRLFPDHPDAARRSQEIADRCSIELDLKARHFPVFTPPEQKKPEEFLRELCEQGLGARFGEPAPPTAVDRLRHELDIICGMGFASYFLIVWDFVRFARENDIDFCQEGRDKVIAYVRSKYGEDSVAQIGTFGTMAARAAVRDVGRVLNIPLARVDQIAKMIPQTLGITLDEALVNSDLRVEYDRDTQIRELIDIARKLEGTNRNAGTHAAGVVISNGPLTEHVPLQRVISKADESGSKQDQSAVTTQWVMGDLEKVGLLKMDFLGLRTLTLLENAVRLIEKTRGEKIDLYKLPLDDKATYALLQRGDAKGVFQLESDGIRELLKRMRPDNINDLIACNALYRPGPLGGGMVEAYVNRKHGREKPVYPHPTMEEILTETYGVMVYQEQVMRILNRLGGIELSSAYACIKAISKKKQEIIDQRRAEFVEGRRQRGVDEAQARELFELTTLCRVYG